MAKMQAAPRLAAENLWSGARLRLEAGLLPLGCGLAAAGFAVLAAPLAMASPAARALAASPIAHTASPFEKIAVFGRDDRRPLVGRRPELRERIGVLRHRGTGAVCSAFCVATDVIATAGHCVSGAATNPAATLPLLRFKRDVDPLAAATGVAPLQSTDAAAIVLTGAPGLNTRPPINATQDWALLRLERPACAVGGLKLSRLSKVEITARAKEGRVFHVAYHRDFRNWRLAIARPCRVLERTASGSADTTSRDFENPGNLLLHTCDTGAASSGSPLLTDGVGGPEVVGINVGTYVRSRVITNDGEIVQRLSSETIANTALAVSPLVAKLQTFTGAEAKGRSRAASTVGPATATPDASHRPGARVASPLDANPSVLVPSGIRNGSTDSR